MESWRLPMVAKELPKFPERAEVSTTRTKAIVRNVLPRPVWKLLQTVRHILDFKYSTRPASPTDYIAAFDHRGIRKARRSILWFDDWDEATDATMQIFREVGLLSDGQTVIDYGCGIGRISKALLERYRLKVLAVDRSSQMLKHARSYLPVKVLDQAKVVLLTDKDLLQRVPRIPGEVDVILFIEVLQHIPEPILDDLLPRLLETLSPEGKLFVLGNALLDVDAQGNIRAKSIEGFLQKHVDIIRSDVWSSLRVGESWKKFRNPRHSFLCSAPQGGGDLVSNPGLSRVTPP